MQGNDLTNLLSHPKVLKLYRMSPDLLPMNYIVNMRQLSHIFLEIQNKMCLYSVEHDVTKLEVDETSKSMELPIIRKSRLLRTVAIYVEGQIQQKNT